jgi:hypothetical protein
MGRYRVHSQQDEPGADDEGQRACARGERCASATSVRQADGSYKQQPALGYRAFCDRCRDMVMRCVEQMPGYLTDLRAQLGDKGRGSGPKVSGSRSAPLPINLNVEALVTDLVDMVASWAGRVALVAGLFGVDADRRLRAYPDMPVQRMCEQLAVHLDVLLGLGPQPMTRFVTMEDAAKLPPGTPGRVHPFAGYAEVVIDLDGADAGLEFARVNSRCRFVLGLTGAAEKIGGRCFSCEQIDVLVRPDGSAGLADYAECSACGTKYFGAEYKLLMRDVYEREMTKQQARKEAS